MCERYFVSVQSARRQTRKRQYNRRPGSVTAGGGGGTYPIRSTPRNHGWCRATRLPKVRLLVDRHLMCHKHLSHARKHGHFPRCVGIVTKDALKRMVFPATFALVTPVVIGLLFRWIGSMSGDNVRQMCEPRALSVYVCEIESMEESVWSVCTIVHTRYSVK